MAQSIEHRTDSKKYTKNEKPDEIDSFENRFGVNNVPSQKWLCQNNQKLFLRILTWARCNEPSIINRPHFRRCAVCLRRGQRRTRTRTHADDRPSENEFGVHYYIDVVVVVVVVVERPCSVLAGTMCMETKCYKLNGRVLMTFLRFILIFVFFCLQLKSALSHTHTRTSYIGTSL